MFVSISRWSKRVRTMHTHSLLRGLIPTSCLLVASAFCASAQTAAMQSETGYSSSQDQAAPALGQASAPALAALAQPGPALPAYGLSWGDPSGRHEAKPSHADAGSGFKKYMFDVGFGVPTSIGNTHNYQTYGVGFQTGFGRNLNPYFGAKVEYDFNYFNIPTTADTENNTGDVLINSILFEPYLNLNPRSRVGLYLTGGGGYNWKTTQFTAPTGLEVCTPTEGCILQSTVVASYSSSSLGMNIGGGLNWRLGSLSNTKLFLEGRYADILAGSTTTNLAYPPANYQTNFVSAEFGFRW